MLGIGPVIDPGIMPLVGILDLCRHDAPNGAIAPLFVLIGALFGNNEGLGLSSS